jgi:hypothetical protein
MRSMECLQKIDVNKKINTITSIKKIKPFHLPSSGYISTASKDERIFVLISTKKGGNLTLYSEKGTISDFGWIIFSNNKQLVTHWFSNQWKIDTSFSVKSKLLEVNISGFFVEHNEVISTPFKHLLLRFSSLLFGRRIISFFKSKLIFKKRSSKISFKRKILVDNDMITVCDYISGLSFNDKIIRAPRSSKRHVASADSFHYEDLSMSHGIDFEEIREKSSDRRIIKTSYFISR